MAKTTEIGNKTALLKEFQKNPPEGWNQLSSRERKEKAVEATGMTPAYLNSVISRDETLKDFFAIIRRAPRKARRKAASVRKTERKEKAPIIAPEANGASPKIEKIEKQIATLDMRELVVLFRSLRRTIDERIQEAKDEIGS